jgi:predicted ATP-grasp superfamily ATP-dependent carboligase
VAVVKILVSAAGGPTGAALVQAFLARGHQVIAADPSPYAVGRLLARDGGVAAPPVHDEDAILDFYKQYAYGVDAAIPLLVDEIPAVIKSGIPYWGCDDIATAVCDDKWAFAMACLTAGIPHPATHLVPPREDGDWVLKPIRGKGSRHTYRFPHAATIAALNAAMTEPMLIQEAALGQEWEFDGFADDGEILGGTYYYKRRMGGGQTMSAETRDIAEVWPLLVQASSVFRLNGPLNIGGFIHDDEPTLLEVNTRFSHNFRIAEAAGANPLTFWERWMAGRPADLDLLDSRPGVRFERLWSHVAA